MTGNSLSSQQIAQGRTNLRGVPCLSTGDAFWEAAVPLTAMWEGHSRSFKTDYHSGRSGARWKQYSVNERLCRLHSNRAFYYSKCAVIRDAAPDTNDGSEDPMWAIIGLKKYKEMQGTHQRFCGGAAFRSHGNSSLEPVKPQTFENVFHSEIFW